MDNKEHIERITKTISILEDQIAKYEEGLFGAFKWANGPKQQQKEQETYDRLRSELEQVKELKQEIESQM